MIDKGGDASGLGREMPDIAPVADTPEAVLHPNVPLISARGNRAKIMARTTDPAAVCCADRSGCDELVLGDSIPVRISVLLGAELGSVAYGDVSASGVKVRKTTD